MKYFLVVFLALFFFSCKKRVFEYVVPENFEGYIFVFYNIKNGAIDKDVDGKTTFTIPNSGIYFTQTPFGKGAKVEYYFIDKKGNKNKIGMNDINNKNYTGKSLILDSRYKATSDGKRNIIDCTVTMIVKNRQDSSFFSSDAKINKIFDSISSNLLIKGLVNEH